MKRKINLTALMICALFGPAAVTLGDYLAAHLPARVAWLSTPIHVTAAIMLLILPLIVLGLFLALREWSHRHDYYRITHGCCMYCGYDLRASHARCPECGRLACRSHPQS